MNPKTIAAIKKEIKKTKADDRYQAEPASIEINAPLALIQVEMESRIKTLKWVLELEGIE